MNRLLLHSGWTVSAAGEFGHVPAVIREAIQGREIPASVPGCVHTDLLSAGLIEDPYLDRNEEKVQWIGRTDWRYRCTFDAEEAILRRRIDLVCEGLDTVARVELNGRLLGESFDMHFAYTWDCREVLRRRGNELVITFRSALNYCEQMEDKLGLRPYVGRHPFHYIRKMACNFGWDWGPTLITAGIWRPIYLRGFDAARLAEVRPMVRRADSAAAEVEVLCKVEAADTVAHGAEALFARVRMTGPDGREVAQVRLPVAAAGGVQTLRLPEIARPQLWWPRGHGAQPLYHLTLDLCAGDDVLDRWESRLGLRTVRLNTEKDALGARFQIEVNGKPIFCKGANWVPDDCFLHRVTEERYRRRLGQAADANMNMLRVWGGGIFESDTFYDLCDELGIMVWQDFLFACAAYPEEEPYRSLVEAEARYHVARLCRHASLVLWNGCNENIWGYFDWGWRALLDPLRRAWGLGYYLDLLPKVVAEVDPTRPYWPGSPYSGSMDIDPAADTHGDKHIWDRWRADGYGLYRRYTPRFCSEFGHQGPPTWPTLARAIPADQRQPGAPAMRAHQKATGGNEKFEQWMALYFEVPAGFDDWHYLMQVMQVRAAATGVEWFRARSPVCMGVLYWQLNDCWPVMSWAAVDGDGRAKPLWYATRRFYADRLLTIQPEPTGALVLHAINDRDEDWTGTATVVRMDFRGDVKARETLVLSVPARSRQRVGTLPAGIASAGDAAGECLVARVPGVEAALWFFDRDKKLRYPAPELDAEWVRVTAGHAASLRITAKVLLRDVAVFADRLDPEAQVSDQLVTILPGEWFTFEVWSQGTLTREALTAPPVFQCANRFGAKG